MLRSSIIFALLFLTTHIPAQDSVHFIFRNNRNFLITVGVDPNDVKEHPLGTGVAEKLVLLKDRYTYIQPAGPTSPVEKTVISKPAIYNSLQKLNRYYKKELKSGTINVEKAKTEFTLCLDIALIIHSENTEDFEIYLDKMNKPEEILIAFQQVILQ